MFDRAPLLERSHKKSASPVPRIPAKLSLARKNDPSEREADRNAARATSSFLSHSISQPSGQRKTIEAKAASSGLPAVDAVMRSPGQPLDARARAWMEPLFLRDFSKVRVHTDEKAARSARALNAHAYTFGSHVAFGAGRFAPETDQGRRLIAHELTHVVQQQSAPRIQRMIETERGDIDLSLVFQINGIDGYVCDKVVDGPNKDRRVYFHKAEHGTDLDSEILLAMLSSGRTFNLSGTTESEALVNLQNHIQARKDIIDMAESNQAVFSEDEQWDSTFWERDSEGHWHPKRGSDPLPALNDLKNNPEKYAMQCRTATELALLAGGEWVPEDGANEADWVPGSTGYIKNTKFRTTNTQEGISYLGQNIIYVGFQKFWGFGVPGLKTLLEWIAHIKEWDGGAQLLPRRERPTEGLLN